MYNDRPSQSVLAEPATREAMLPALNYKLAELLDIQEKHIAAISEKMHSVLDKRSDIKEREEISPKPSNDFYSEIQGKIIRLERHNKGLNDIVNHLIAIV